MHARLLMLFLSVHALFSVRLSLAAPPVSASCKSKTIDTITTSYAKVKLTPSDINEHIPVIYDYVKQADHATELGVRNVVSSWAFLKAGLDRVQDGQKFAYVASDITKTTAAEELDQLDLACLSIDYSFVEGDDLVIDTWDTDVLLIDTWHTYRQLAAELPRWAPHVRQTIILHDTELFGAQDESQGGHGDKPVDEQLFQAKAGVGLQQALQEFLTAFPDWTVHERRTNNNGLTVLKRVLPD